MAIRVTFAPSQTSVLLAVVPVDDEAPESPETVVFSLAASQQYASQTDNVTLTLIFSRTTPARCSAEK